VDATARSIRAMLRQVAAHGDEWLKAVRAADRSAAALAGESVPLVFTNGPKVRVIEFQGYAYTRTPSEVSGALMTRYDESKPEVWRVPLFDHNVALRSPQTPAGGYLVPAAQAELVAAKLDLHGIRYRRLDRSPGSLAVQEYRADTVKLGTDSVESHQRVETTGQWRDARFNAAAGSLFVPMAQPKARLLVALLEPESPDSLLAWGFFNAFFERKEYMEDYVAEAVAREMLADPAIKAEFEAALRDPAFAASAAQRLEFFASRHASWDTQYRLYPVRRTALVVAD
jgi:hypothetical protein